MGKPLGTIARRENGCKKHFQKSVLSWLGLDWVYRTFTFWYFTSLHTVFNRYYDYYRNIFNTTAAKKINRGQTVKS